MTLCTYIRSLVAQYTLYTYMYIYYLCTYVRMNCTYVHTYEANTPCTVKRDVCTERTYLTFFLIPTMTFHYFIFRKCNTRELKNSFKKNSIQEKFCMTCTYVCTYVYVRMIPQILCCDIRILMVTRLVSTLACTHIHTYIRTYLLWYIICNYT